MTEDSKSLDILGIKPIGDAALHVTKVTTDGAASFIARICMPAAEEIGLLLQDKVKRWRARNATAILLVAEEKLAKNQPGAKTFALPRLIHAAIENGSWTDDDLIHKMWGGLLASSCTPDGGSETNLIFTSVLSRMTGVQVRLLTYACVATPKIKAKSGLIISGIDPLITKASDLLQVAGLTDIHQLDLELDHLRELGLIQAGFTHHDYPDELEDLSADITATAFALNLYVRSQGYIGPPTDYFGLSE